MQTRVTSPINPSFASLLTPSYFQDLYQQHAGSLCYYLTRCLNGDKIEAEGIVQEAFLKAWEKRDTLREIRAFKAWLYSIAMNVLRQRQKKPRLVPISEGEYASNCLSPEQHAAGNQELDKTIAAFDCLSSEQLQALLLVRIEGLKFREAAEVLEISENTVKTRVRRALIKLADELDL